MSFSPTLRMGTSHGEDRDAPASLNRSASSRMKRLGTSLRKGGSMLKKSSKALVQRIQEPRSPGTPLLRSTSSSTASHSSLGRSRSVLHSLLRFRKEDAATSQSFDSDSGAAENENENGIDIDTAGSLDEPDHEESLDTFALDDESPRTRRSRSIVEWKSEPKEKRSSGEKKRDSWKRVSLRGLTKEDGLLTRDEAKRFSLNRRERSMSKEEAIKVIGRNSISINSLLRLAKKGEQEKVVALVESGLVDVNAKSAENGKTALICSAGHGHTATVIALYGLDADLEVSDNKGNTALIAAAAKGRSECVLTLLSCGADTKKKNRRGDNALVAAANKLAVSGDSREFKEYITIVRAFFERAIVKPHAKDIAEYTEEDSARVEELSARTLLDEWLQAKLKHKDLHTPSYEMFRGADKHDLLSFFESAHKRMNLSGWIKVIVLMLFIVYDTYSPHFSDTYITYTVYVLLYCGAYYV